jgi:hypothetical protein
LPFGNPSEVEQKNAIPCQDLGFLSSTRNHLEILDNPSKSLVLLYSEDSQEHDAFHRLELEKWFVLYKADLICLDNQHIITQIFFCVRSDLLDNWMETTAEANGLVQKSEQEFSVSRFVLSNPTGL